jgi:hypothetical protein
MNIAELAKIPESTEKTTTEKTSFRAIVDRSAVEVFTSAVGGNSEDPGPGKLRPKPATLKPLLTL